MAVDLFHIGLILLKQLGERASADVLAPGVLIDVHRVELRHGCSVQHEPGGCQLVGLLYLFRGLGRLKLDAILQRPGRLAVPAGVVQIVDEG